MSATALTNLQQFTDSLYGNVLQHLPKIAKQVAALNLDELPAGINAAAVKFAESGDQKDREEYLFLKQQVAGIKERGAAAIRVAQAILSDPLLGEATRQKVYEAFPALAPVTIAEAAPAEKAAA